MRATSIAALTTLVLLFAPVPVLAQDLPAVPGAPALPAGPAVPAVPGAPNLPSGTTFFGTFQDVPYYVLDGVVHRLDAQKVDPSAAQEIVKAQRVNDLLSADPAFATRLAQREAALGAFDGQLAQLEGAAAKIQNVAGSLGVAEAEGLLGGLTQQLPIRPVDLLTDANAARAKVASARGAIDDVQAKSADVRSKLESFQATHSVEDKRALLDSMTSAVPAYRAAAAQAGAAQARVQRAATDAQASLDAVETRSESFLFDLVDTDATIPTDLASATSALQGVAGSLQSFADGLRSDAAFMETVAHEAAETDFPVAWVVGGGAGAAGLGLGSLWMLRRKVGLP